MIDSDPNQLHTAIAMSIHTLSSGYGEQGIGYLINSILLERNG